MAYSETWNMSYKIVNTFASIHSNVKLIFCYQKETRFNSCIHTEKNSNNYWVIKVIIKVNASYDVLFVSFACLHLAIIYSATE